MSTEINGYQALADSLISEGFLLTALEFHTELCERGKELPYLKEFFQDTSNFDKFIKRPDIPPSPSPSHASVDGDRLKQRADSQVVGNRTYLQNSTLFNIVFAGYVG